jgi:N-acetylmuramoyl-L-alanine amidase
MTDRRGRWRGALLGAAAALAALCGGARAADPENAAGAQPYVAQCPLAADFVTVIDVGHTPDVPGAMSARGVPEYEFNLRLARKIDTDLRAAGFARTVLMLTSKAPRAGLFKRAEDANTLGADLFLAIHHDAAPESFLETWQVNGQEQHYSDRFPGHSLYVSQQNGDPRGSLAFAHLLGMELKRRGLQYTAHYTEPYMGRWRHELIDQQAGVYRYDNLVVLMQTHMPAVLLEAGSIINRDEELALETPERQALTSGAVVMAVDAFCTARSPKRPGPVATQHR